MTDLSLPTLAAKLKANMNAKGWGTAETAAQCGMANQDVYMLTLGVLDFQLPFCQAFANFNDPVLAAVMRDIGHGHQRTAPRSRDSGPTCA
jgi:hypothetical protein